MLFKRALMLQSQFLLFLLQIQVEDDYTHLCIQVELGSERL